MPIRLPHRPTGCGCNLRGVRDADDGRGAGRSRARSERAARIRRLTEIQARRQRSVIALAAQALSTAALENPALDDARGALAVLDRDHSERSTRERALADLATREAALEREAARVHRRQTALDAELARLDATRERLLAARDRRPSGERAGLDAELVSGRANRAIVARERPGLDGELAALAPQLATIAATRAAQLEAGHRAPGPRTGDDLARTARDARLAALGEALMRNRLAELGQALADVDELDAAIATEQRRIVDLDQLASVDQRARLRGLAVTVAMVTAALAVLWMSRS